MSVCAAQGLRARRLQLHNVCEGRATSFQLQKGDLLKILQTDSSGSCAVRLDPERAAAMVPLPSVRLSVVAVV